MQGLRLTGNYWCLNRETPRPG